MSKNHDKEKDSCSNSSQDQNKPKLETLPDMGEYAVPRQSKTVSCPNSSTPASRKFFPSFISFLKGSIKSRQQKRSTSDNVSKAFPQASARCSTEETTPMEKSESDISHKPDSLCGGVTVSISPTEVSRPIMSWQREEREEMKRKAQREREQAARITKLGLDCNVADRDQHSTEHDLQPVSYSVIPFEHMPPENIDLEASESKNTDSFDLTESDASEVNEEVSENLTSGHASLSNENEGDQQNREDVLTELQTSTQEIRSDISDSTVFPNSETVSNPKTSTPTSRDILHPFSSFIKCHNEFQSRRRSTSDIDSITFPQASARSCATQETTLMDTVQIHKLCPRSKSESDISHQPAFPCVTEVSRPIMIWQREKRDEMKRKAQREREQAARITKLGLDRNVLENRDKHSTEHDLQHVSYSVIPFEHMPPENIDLEASESKNTDSFDLTEGDASEVNEEVSENLL
ncbi:hypothetical protein Q7C36_016673 [Tachysurus vachellii]|uniref:Uncharacterized protein n=1 Tax=Tachysurus vachellii TaxID=175792 RepID=A0AA88MA30_TACVA|nr:hypothetical protein Q7C36_016673 [Tachysurus vachellii]